jgi:hypothetical protein
MPENLRSLAVGRKRKINSLDGRWVFQNVPRYVKGDSRQTRALIGNIGSYPVWRGI